MNNEAVGQVLHNVKNIREMVGVLHSQSPEFASLTSGVLDIIEGLTDHILDKNIAIDLLTSKLKEVSTLAENLGHQLDEADADNRTLHDQLEKLQ